MSTISEDQIATRRRALGRKLTTKGGLLETLVGELNGSVDLQFLNEREAAALAKQLKQIEVIGSNFMKVGRVLEGRS